MHIVLLNQAFHPDVVATAQMAKDLADHLACDGHQVTAVASRSIYGTKGASLPKRETIRVPRAGKDDAVIEVHRVGSAIFGKAGIAGRLFDFLMFYVLAFFKLLFMRRADVIVAFSTPPYIALVPVILRWIRGSRAVYWAMDLYPDVAVQSGLLGEKALLTRILDRIHRFIIRNADATVVLGRCMESRVLAKGAPRDKVHFIPVWSDESGVVPVEHADNPMRATLRLTKSLAVMYSGNFGLGHDAATMLQAMKSLEASPPPGGPVQFRFVGGGKRKAEVLAFIEQEKLAHASWHDYVPRDQLARSLSAADVHLISLLEGMEGLIVPSKLFGIMAVARPAIFIGNPTSEIARVLTESGAGVVVRQGDAPALEQAIRMFAADPGKAREMGRRARESLLGRYDKSTACAQWAALLKNVTARH
jgi:colanic acid biosynthesis glycosyl transferase WcaI